MPARPGLFIVPDTWFFPGKTAMAVTAHFPPTTPLACVGGNNAPKPGVVGIDALVGAYAQTGRLCPMVIGTMPETGEDPDYDDETKDEIVDLGYAVMTAAALRGRRFLSVDTDSMQMETALNHVHAARRTSGLGIDPGVDEDLRRHAPQEGRLRPGRAAGASRVGPEHQVPRPDLQQHRRDHEAKGCRIYTGGNVKPPALTAEDRRNVDEGLALYLILRNVMARYRGGGRRLDQPAGLGLGSPGPAACPRPTSPSRSSTPAGTTTAGKPVVPFATENDVQGLLTMILHCWLSGGQPTLFMDFRKVYEPWEIEKNARAVGLGPASHSGAAWMERGFIDGNNQRQRLAGLRRKAVPVQGGSSTISRAADSPSGSSRPGGFEARPAGWAIPT